MMVSWIWLIVVGLVTLIVSLILFSAGVQGLRDESYREGFKRGYLEAKVEMQKKERRRYLEEETNGQKDKCSENLRDNMQGI